MPLDVCPGYTLPFNCQATVPGLSAAPLHIQLAAWWVSGASFVHASAFQTNLDVWGDSACQVVSAQYNCCLLLQGIAWLVDQNNRFQENALKWGGSWGKGFSTFVDIDQNCLLIAFQSTKQNKQTNPQTNPLASHAFEDTMNLCPSTS